MGNAVNWLLSKLDQYEKEANEKINKGTEMIKDGATILSRIEDLRKTLGRR